MSSAAARRGASAYTPGENLVFRRIGEEGVLVPTTGQSAKEGTLFALNELGALIWGMLIDRADRSEIINRIVATYRVDAESAAADLDQFVFELVAAGCLRRSGQE